MYIHKLITIINGYMRIFLFNDIQLVFWIEKKVPLAFIMKFILASSADLGQPDFVKIRWGPLRALKLLSKIQEDACFVGCLQNIISIKGTGGFDYGAI